MITSGLQIIHVSSYVFYWSACFQSLPPTMHLHVMASKDGKGVILEFQNI
jgi:hypothetical protein